MVSKKELKKLEKQFIDTLTTDLGPGDYSIEWHTDTYKLFKWPTGIPGWLMYCTVSATGFKITMFKFIVTPSDNHWEAKKQSQIRGNHEQN